MREKITPTMSFHFEFLSVNHVQLSTFCSLKSVKLIWRLPFIMKSCPSQYLLHSSFNALLRTLFDTTCTYLLACALLAQHLVDHQLSLKVRRKQNDTHPFIHDLMLKHELFKVDAHKVVFMFCYAKFEWLHLLLHHYYA